MFDIKSFYEAKDVQDAVQALVNEPDAEVISGGTDVLIRVREGKDAGKALVSIHNMDIPFSFRRMTSLFIYSVSFCV